jgi:hypothetical protein
LHKSRAVKLHPPLGVALLAMCVALPVHATGRAERERGEVATGGKKRTSYGAHFQLVAPTAPPSATFSDEPPASGEPAAPEPPRAVVYGDDASEGAAHDKAQALVKEREWYGYYTMLADVTSLSVIGAGVYVDNNMTRAATGELDYWLIGIGTAGLFLGSPAVHFSQGQGGCGVASLGIRVAAPIVGFAIGYNILPDERDSRYGCQDGYGNCEDQLVMGMLFGFVGAVTAVVFDHSVLAWKPTKKPSHEVAWSLLPFVDRQRAGAAVSGTF